MNQSVHTGEYIPLIKKIRRRRNTVKALMVIATLAVLALCLPINITFLDKTVVDLKGANPVLMVFFILLICIVGTIAFVIVSLPLTTSLIEECDPQKYLALNAAMLTKPQDKDPAFAIGNLYSGDFRTAITFADRMISTKKPKIVLPGYFDKAICEFCLGDFDALNRTADQYHSYLTAAKGLSPKSREAYEKIEKTILLSVAIAGRDMEKASAYRGVEVWKKTKSSKGLVDYLKGVAAYYLNDKNEAIYRLMSVKDFCGKTVFARLADEYLSRLNENDNV